MDPGLTSAGFDAALEGFAALDEAALARPWVYRGHPMDVRYALCRTLEDAQEAYVRLAATRGSADRRRPGSCRRWWPSASPR